MAAGTGIRAVSRHGALSGWRSLHRSRSTDSPCSTWASTSSTIDPNWFDTMRLTKLPSFEEEFGEDGSTYAGVRQTRWA